MKIPCLQLASVEEHVNETDRFAKSFSVKEEYQLADEVEDILDGE